MNLLVLTLHYAVYGIVVREFQSIVPDPPEQRRMFFNLGGAAERGHDDESSVPSPFVESLVFLPPALHCTAAAVAAIRKRGIKSDGSPGRAIE